MTAFSVHKGMWTGNASIKSYVRKGIVMVTKTVKVINKQGMHMRPASVLASEMKKFPGCVVNLQIGDKIIKTSSVMQIMAAGLKYGTEVKIDAEGANEEMALDKAVELFETGFGEKQGS